MDRTPGGIGGQSETITFSQTFSVGAASVSVPQDVRFRVIANGQFQHDIFASATETLDLGLLGLLDVTMKARSGQSRGDSRGGSFTQATLLLRAPVVSATEPGTLAIFGIGLAGLGYVRRRRAAQQGLQPREPNL